MLCNYVDAQHEDLVLMDKETLLSNNTFLYLHHFTERKSAMRSLRKAYLEITNVCNLSCNFCPGTRREKSFLSPHQFRTLANKIRPHTEYLYLHLMGEPLLHPQLKGFLAIAGELGFKVIITTNGTLLNKRGEEILAAGVHKVNLSLHSFENGADDAHGRYVGELADFAKRAADQGTIVVFRLWNKGFDHGKNQVAYDLLKEKIPANHGKLKNTGN